MKNAECENGDEIDAVSEGAPWETPIVRNGKCRMQNEDWRVPGDMVRSAEAMVEINIPCSKPPVPEENSKNHRCIIVPSRRMGKTLKNKTTLGEGNKSHSVAKE